MNYRRTKDVLKQKSNKTDAKKEHIPTRHKEKTDVTFLHRMYRLNDKNVITSYHTYIEPMLKHILNIEDHIYFYSHKRSLLIDWIIDAHFRLELSQETLYITIRIIDTMMLKNDFTDEKLQLLAITALFLAGKYEEVAVPTIETIKCLGEYKFCEDTIYKAEKYVLFSLDYKIPAYCPLIIIRFLNRIDDYDNTIRNAAKYMLELGNLYKELLPHCNYVKSTVSYYIAKKMFGKNDFEMFWYYCPYQKTLIEQIADLYVDILKSDIVYDFVYKKYDCKGLNNVSKRIKHFYK